MSKTVDFEFTKKWGSITKGTVKSFRPQHARSLQDVRKVGKILGKTKTQTEIDDLETYKADVEQATEERVEAVKKSAETEVSEAKGKADKAEIALKAEKDKSKSEITAMKKELQEEKKKTTAVLKAQRIAENKMDKLVKQRATK